MLERHESCAARRRRKLRNTLTAILTTVVAATLVGAGQPAAADTKENTPPDVPGQLTVDSLPCVDNLAVSTATPTLTALLTDPDAVPPYAEQVTATFAWWPVDQPTQRTEQTSSSWKSVPTRFQHRLQPGALVDSGTYAFAVQATDRAGATSMWSAECRFTVDISAPAQPTVSSTDYPDDSGWHGGPGIPGRFTFSAGGDTDTVGFRYDLSGQPTTAVAADAPGGSATVTITPDRDGPRSLSVQAVDRAGNRSPATTYVFRVADTSPTVSSVEYPLGRTGAPVGTPGTFVFQPGMPGVIEYVYSFDGRPAATVAADAGGAASVTWTPSTAGLHRITVHTRTVDGTRSETFTGAFLVARAS
ncbi:hypothetical protein E1193_21360 [Micromonospora sp. KC606]|uniref:hypothetical protein n=1 Tax=Micromonospora sp. KC606 TaxID=2530379 RepID=UPI00104461F0|nr:hypothetical protein [Micromonospora sp. KC606]TDC78047.1 hypothetical protein E1193_21360 [Micromonospora sp. KC606]